LPEVGRALPHSLEAEEKLLASIFIDSAEIMPLCRAARFSAKSFYEPRHGLIFSAMLALSAGAASAGAAAAQALSALDRAAAAWRLRGPFNEAARFEDPLGEDLFTALAEETANAVEEPLSGDDPPGAGRAMRQRQPPRRARRRGWLISPSPPSGLQSWRRRSASS
jgi:hypothetical protein